MPRGCGGAIVDDGLAHRLHRRPGLRAVDAAAGCRERLGCADGGRAAPARVRPIGSKALNMARIEAGLRPAEPRFCLRGAHPVPRHRALSAGAGAGVAGRLQEGTLHRAPGAAGRAAARAAPPAGGPGRRGHQARPQCASLYRSAPADGRPAASPRRPGRPPASAISRWRWWMPPIIATGSTLWAEIYLNRELVWERRMVRARVVERPFFAPARRRATPPADF